MTHTLSAPQALIYAMFTTSAADNSMNDAEMRRIGSVVRNLPAFRNYDENDLIDEAKAWGEIASGPDGLNAVLDMISAALPDNLRETAYILAAEVAASDLSSRPEERRFLQLLAQSLKLDRLTVAALERAALARHQQVLDS
ncbi:MAG: tellurite resistance TerB family protein [Alphaproteobacteria bacterium]|nr:tellurite resistance TerB family protein [Alphaproteobacteria bacterium]